MKTLIVAYAVLGLISCVPYIPEVSKVVLQYAKISQCSSDVIENWSCTPCQLFPQMKNVTVIKNEVHATQCVIMYDPTEQNIIVSFRGTYGRVGWLWDFDSIRINDTDCSGCLVHEGFWLGYQSMKNEIINYVDLLVKEYPTYSNIITTGHSLGAALSTLAAIDFVKRYGRINIYYNFGSPRVGNQNFASYFDKLVPTANRVTHFQDIVPHSPLQETGYHHIAREIWYSDLNSTEYKICNLSGEDPTCADSIPWQEWSMQEHMYYLNTYCGC